MGVRLRKCSIPSSISWKYSIEVILSTQNICFWRIWRGVGFAAWISRPVTLGHDKLASQSPESLHSTCHPFFQIKMSKLSVNIAISEMLDSLEGIASRLRAKWVACKYDEKLHQVMWWTWVWTRPILSSYPIHIRRREFGGEPRPWFFFHLLKFKEYCLILFLFL